jgi:inositol-hexakisphosphate/diphosphoinositol-pentakisphosphate 1-kinase
MSVSERGGERVEKIVLGICAMDKKTSSKPMKEIMNRIEKTSIFQIKYISDKVKFEQPVETWPVVRLSPTTDHFHNKMKTNHSTILHLLAQVHALIAFFSTGFPMEKVEDYIRLRKPFLVNDLEPQKVLWDRRKVNYWHMRASRTILQTLLNDVFSGLCSSSITRHPSPGPRRHVS